MDDSDMSRGHSEQAADPEMGSLPPARNTAEAVIHLRRLAASRPRFQGASLVQPLTSMADQLNKHLPSELQVAHDDERAKHAYLSYPNSTLAEATLVALGYYSTDPLQSLKAQKAAWSIAVLGRYFVWTRAMWTAAVAQDNLRTNVEVALTNIDPLDDPGEAQLGLLLHWLASLEVVIEGWERLKLDDTDIQAQITEGGDPLVPDSMRYRLRRFRNAVFHFQVSGSDSTKFSEFWSKDTPAALWTIKLERAFERYFRAVAQRQREEIHEMQTQLAHEDDDSPKSVL